MADILWTESQKKAIDTRDKNILVSAAAGSGKTAVLVERILKRVMEDGVDIDEMLIVTFTKAAAAEMKEKINKRLRGYEADSPDGIRRIRHQINCLDDAEICTIDSFCMNCVRSFAQELNIAQDFRMCDPAEDAMIIEEAALGIISAYYKKNDADFIKFTRYYCDRYHDSKLIELITRIYGFIQSYAEPMKKLEDIFRFYKNDGRDIFNDEWASFRIKKELDDVKKIALKITRIDRDGSYEKGKGSAEDFFERVSMPPFSAEQSATERLAVFSDTLRKYAKGNDKDAGKVKDVIKGLISYADIIREIMELDEKGGEASWEKLYEAESALKSISCEKSRGRKQPDYDYNDYIEYFRTVTEGTLLNISQSAETVKKQHEIICSMAAQIMKMVRELSDKIDEIKRRRNTYSFADVEHMAYRLLTSEEHSEIAELYRERYKDIMIDEYQDTNGLQDAIFESISRGNNLFMVGDLKQSIYAFRGGDPTIFKTKGVEYTPCDEDTANSAGSVRINLADNFRSNSVVVNAVNQLFCNIMTDNTGDVDYIKKGEYLVCGRDRGDSDEIKASYADKKSELVMIPVIGAVKENGTEIDASMIEARYVAKRIREMVDSGKKVCAGGEVRPVRYSDFTVIANSVKNLVNIYNDAFAREGVPLGIPVLGYYDFFEISVVLSFLRILINRRLDVPLVTVMRSPIGGFTDDELAQISAYGTTEAFYEKMYVFSFKKKDSALSEKIQRFIALLDKFEKYKHYKGIATIVYDIYTETGFYDFVGAMEGGVQAQKNLILFYEKAKTFAEKGTNGLYSFVKYMEKLRAENNDEAGASLVSDSQNVVRMMTIHASKGLEFPIVFAVSCGKKFRAESGEDGILNRETGIGLKYMDPETKICINTPIYSWVRESIRRENRSEDVRKFYVGLTRAREKLICVAAQKYTSIEKYNEAMKEYSQKGSILKDSTENRRKALEDGREFKEWQGIAEAKGFFEWLLESYYAGGDEVWKLIALDGKEKGSVEDYYNKDVYSIIQSRYPYEKLKGMPSKTTVSRIKEENNRSGIFEARYATELARLPEREKREEKTNEKKTFIPANVMGTAYHRVMELMEPSESMDEDSVKEQIKKLCDSGKLAKATGEQIKPEYITSFFRDNEMGERIIKAAEKGKLYRETPFEIAISPSDYDSSLCGKDYTEQDKILLQGTIDCWFEEEDGRCVIIDYKTDKKTSKIDDKKFMEMKAEEYRLQLELYARAVDMLENKSVSEKYLYLFDIGKFVSF